MCLMSLIVCVVVTMFFFGSMTLANSIITNIKTIYNRDHIIADFHFPLFFFIFITFITYFKIVFGYVDGG